MALALQIGRYVNGTIAVPSRGARVASRRAIILIAIFGFILLIVIAGAILASQTANNWARNRIDRTLESTFAGRLEVQSLQVSLLPSVHVVGTGLRLLETNQAESAPIVVIDKFTADTGLLSLMRLPVRIQHVRIDGLQIHVRAGDAGRVPVRNSKPPNFVVGEIVADGTRVETIPSAPGKMPLVWDLKTLVLHDAGPYRAASFRATLTNAVPPGDIQTTGSFGPWRREAPAQTPVSGSYMFRNANLAVFPGISGILSSDGNYRGVLQNIEVDGTTDTPDFATAVAGNRVDLSTKFHALVDGTNGTTHLFPVIAHFGRSTLVARGVVDTTPGKPGKIIALDARVRNGRLEDMLRLAVQGKPPLTGTVSYHTKILIPPGNQDMAKKLDLDGMFDVESARFSEPSTQEKIDKLSNRGRGQTNDAADDTVASNFQGRFKLHNGVMHFDDLSFVVPGVAINLIGDYDLDGAKLDLAGTARLQAKLSHTTTGFKSLLLKAADPFFAKDGAGAVLPIRITGTKDSPSFKLNLGRKAKKT